MLNRKDTLENKKSTRVSGLWRIQDRLLHHSAEKQLSWRLIMKIKYTLFLTLLTVCFQVFSAYAENNKPDINKMLIEASKNGEIQAVADFIELGADVNTKDEFGFAPLIAAVAQKCNSDDKKCHKNKVAVIQFLLEKGADINARTNNKNTALVYAIENRDFDMIGFLIENGITKDIPGHVINSIAINAAKAEKYDKELDLLKFLSKHGISFEKTWNDCTPLLNALSANMLNTNFANELLKMGVNTHVADKDGQTALMWASANPDSKAFKYILSVSTPEEINKRSKSKSTALHWASRNGLSEHASLLIKAGAEVDPKTDSGFTPLHLSADIRNEYLINNHVATARVLLENGADVNSVDNRGESTLTLVAEYSSPEYILLLLKHGANPSHCNNSGISAVFKMASKGNAKAIGLLYSHKADVNMASKQGISPLIEAIRRSHFDAVMTLINCGADINHMSNAGDSAIHIAAQTENALPIINKLIDAGADINLKGPKGETPLMLSINRKNCKAALRLLDGGSDINSVNNKGETALHYAVKWNSDCNVAQKLIGKKADVNMQNNRGETPLMLSRSLTATKQLIAAGADPAITDSRGLKALSHARLSGNNDIAEYLMGVK